jgi:hypothetical protein
MIVETTSPTLVLAAGELLRLPAGACATVLCSQGAVWVTQQGERRDLVLSAGETAELGASALVLVQAFEPSLIQMRARPAGCAAGRSGSAANRSPRRRSLWGWGAPSGAAAA